MDEDYGCDADISAVIWESLLHIAARLWMLITAFYYFFFTLFQMHAALADVAAAKARMFVNKPDGSTLLFPTFSIYMFLLNQELFLKEP